MSKDSDSESEIEIDPEETMIKLLELVNDWNKKYNDIFKNIIKSILKHDVNDSDKIKEIKLFIHETNIKFYDSPTYVDGALQIIRASYVPFESICNIIVEHMKTIEKYCEKLKSITKILTSDDSDYDKTQKVSDALL